MNEQGAWDASIQKWVRRILLDPGWKVTVKATAELSEPYSAQAHQDGYMYRRALIEYRPGAKVQNTVSCHEVLHIALAPLMQAARESLKHLGKAGAVGDAWLTDAEERATEILTDAFLAAYREKADEP